MKIRRSCSGAHHFDRDSGLNILFDEISYSPDEWDVAPRFVSFAITNACELQCPFCYAPKTPASRSLEQVLEWTRQLDTAGALGVGLGGGEPSAHPLFLEMCRAISRDTRLAVSFTTHGHRMTERLASQLRGEVHFVRLSVDGVGHTYERLLSLLHT